MLIWAISELIMITHSKTCNPYETAEQCRNHHNVRGRFMGQLKGKDQISFVGWDVDAVYDRWEDIQWVSFETPDGRFVPIK